MQPEEIRQKVKQIIADVADLEVGEIADDARFIEDLDLDSLAMLEMGVDVDYAFKLRVGDDRLKELRSVGDTVDLVLQCLAGAERSEVA